MKSLATIAIIILLSVASVFSQDSLENLNKAIEANPNDAENYMKRYEFYKDIWEENQNDLESLARSAADLSKYISLKPNDAEAYRIRAAVREALFLGANPFSIADYKKVLQFMPNDENVKARLAKMQNEYRKLYTTEECKNGRGKSGFQGHPTDIPMTNLSDAFDSELSPENTTALKFIACGADVNYRYKFDKKAPEFNGFSFSRLEHLVAMIEAGANIEGKNSLGDTPLIATFRWFAQQNEKIDQQFIDELKIFLQYDANVNAKNLKGQTAMTFAKKIGNKEVIALLENRMAQNFAGEWSFSDGRFDLGVTLKDENGKLTGDYSNFSSKTSEGKILSSKINGNVATIEIDCDWGGKGTVQLTLLKGNKLHWKVIKRDEKGGDFIVLLDQILSKK